MRGNRAWHASASPPKRSSAYDRHYDYDGDDDYYNQESETTSGAGYAQTMSSVRARVKDMRPRGRFGERHSTIVQREREQARARKAADMHQVRHVEELDRDRFWMRQNDAFVRRTTTDRNLPSAVQRDVEDEASLASPVRPPYALDPHDDVDDRKHDEPPRRFKEPARKVATRVWENPKMPRARSKVARRSQEKEKTETIEPCQLKEAYAKGDAVTVLNASSRTREKPGKVMRANFDGTYDVRYADGRIQRRAKVKSKAEAKIKVRMTATQTRKKTKKGSRIPRGTAPEWDNNSNVKPFSKRQLKTNETLSHKAALWVEDEARARRSGKRILRRTATATTDDIENASTLLHPEVEKVMRPSTASASTTSARRRIAAAQPSRQRPSSAQTGSSRHVYSQFRKQYLRGDLPVLVDHGAKRVVLWKADIRSLDLTEMLPLFMDGLRETAEPYAFLAYAGTLDMLDNGGDAVDVAIPHMIAPLKRALDTRSRVVVSRALRVVQRLVVATPTSGRALVPYYRQLLPVFNRITLLEGEKGPKPGQRHRVRGPKARQFAKLGRRHS